MFYRRSLFSGITQIISETTAIDNVKKYNPTATNGLTDNQVSTLLRKTPIYTEVFKYFYSKERIKQ